MTSAPSDLLRLTQWLSPSFPVSAYAYSHGLEAAIAAGRVCDGATAEGWIATVLQAGSGRTDAILLAAAMAPDADLDALSDVARALAGSAERWEETRAQGAAFAATLRAMGAGGPDRPYPLAVAEAARGLSLPPETVAALFLHAFAGALVSVAVRFVPLGQAEGQRVLAALAPVIERVASDAARVSPDAVEEALGGAAFGADLAAMEHETQEVRLFRT
ncbi:urease accessory UreF family protein [Roseibacterium sp. SDUM158017]|uniref:urease accessory protein UreF n=1 Tax=Roseicyclus salinarum TaxID=3036773 RepID=UPI00241564A9|nr:urease accessory UreF family protein [Roseibacterium sp. SDUM158017]MDG4650036.1 urease accessory UreF family protein [Roseibacterium sp. SDUM158017]